MPAADAPVPQHSRTTHRRRRDMKRDRLLGLAIAAGIGARAALIRRPRRTLVQRLAEFPATAPVEAPLRIHWNEQQVPFVDAHGEGDLAVGLGMVHAHLRLAQMEIMRRAAQGRLSESIGPLGVEADRALRLLDLGHAVPAIIAAMAPDTRAWAEGFVRGVNHVLQHMRILPEEMRLLGIGRDPWSLADLLTNARLAGADVNWAVYGRLLRARAALSAHDWQAVWPRLLADGMPNPEGAAASLARAGSNAAAVAGWRSRSGSALFAADPHLSIALPNVWLAVGMHCPTLNVVGLMPAGFPLVAIGRNAHLAWGGTSLHAAASDLIDVSGETLDARVVGLRVRGAGTREVTLRRSVHGPVVSDGMLLRYPTPLALRWIGHTPSDEIGAMLGVMRARNSEDFAAALRGFAIPGQNMLHATADGHVGHLLALAAPRRPATAPADLVLPPEAAGAWNDLAHTPEFPDRLDPASGVVASANDEPPPGRVPAGFFFSPPDRVQRLHALLGGPGLLDLDDMARTQTDVQGRIETVRAVAERLPDHPARTMLLAWDGRYDTGSEGAVVFEALMADLARRLPGQAKLRPLTAIWTGRRLLAHEVLSLDDAVLRPLAIAAMDAATALLRRRGSWGKLHRMRIRHYFGTAPLVGRRYRFGSYGAAGGNDTLNKTGHGPVRGRHGVSYGASARFLADMADPDANRVVLLGGQDGWLGSDSFADQVPLWRRGGTMALPLRVQTARGWPHVSVLDPV